LRSRLAIEQELTGSKHDEERHERDRDDVMVSAHRSSSSYRTPCRFSAGTDTPREASAGVRSPKPKDRSPTLCRSPVLSQPVVNQRHDLVQCFGLQSALASDAPNQTVDALDMLRAAKERPGRRRRFAEAGSGRRIFVEGHEVLVQRSESSTKLRHPPI